MANDTWRTDPTVFKSDWTPLLEHAAVEWWENHGRALSEQIRVQESDWPKLPSETETAADTDGPRQWWTPFTEFEKPAEPPSRFSAAPTAARFSTSGRSVGCTGRAAGEIVGGSDGL